MAVELLKTGARSAHYVGEVKNLRRDGFGVYTYSNKFFRYEGEWKEGKKHGHGKLVMADGSYYEGEFQNGEITGSGFRRWQTSANSYSGQFKEGELHGFGVLNYGTGAVYEGEFSENVREGHGILTESYGDVYEGTFHNNDKHGDGIQQYINGEHYEGTWVKGMKQGHGELHYSDGTVYEGQFRGDLINGEGTMVHCSGVCYEGLWINGRPELEPHHISAPESIDVCAGSPFNVDLELMDSSNQNISSTSGYKLQISAWFKQVTLPSTEDSQSQLFDLIEDMEEEAIDTPFGYTAVWYPLTEYHHVVKPSPETESTAENVEEESDPPLEGDVTAELPVEQKPPTPQERAESLNDELTTEAPEEFHEDVLPSPPAQEFRNGAATFPSLILPSAPPSYRPFAILDAMKLNSTKRKSGKDDKGKSAKEPQPVEKEISDAALANNNPFARPGQYILRIVNVSEPDFFGAEIEPVYIVVNVSPQPATPGTN